MRGSLSGKQELKYGGARAYDHESGIISPDEYQARLIAKVLRAPYSTRRRYFQVRTRSTVNMTQAYRHNIALMGGSGAMFAELQKMKTSEIYSLCVAVCPREKTLRAFIMPILRAGLAAKTAQIVVADGVVIINPWISSEEPNVPVGADVLDKFSSELSNT